MAGCYDSNDPEDRARERELDRYLDRTYGEPKDEDDEPPERDKEDEDLADE